jgi:hypothetical protein
MTRRSILAGQSPSVVVRAGGDVRVEGWDSDRVQAESDSRRGLKVEQHSESEITRARAKVGDHVLFDVRLNVRHTLKKEPLGEVIDVQIGGSGKVYVPLASTVKVYAGQSVDAQDLRGRVAVTAGSNAHVRNVHTLVHASAGGSLDFECEQAAGDEVKFTAGRDLRCAIRSLTDATFMIDDLGGYWEAVLGDGRTKILLKAGGDVTLVTDQAVTSQSPYDAMGNVERPGAASNEGD